MESALKHAGEREIGGVLMGEHLEEGKFRIRDVSIQRRRGSVAAFARSLTGAVRALRRYFRDTGAHYTRYNYLGEWHSHPCFSVSPSGTDRASMREIVDDPQVGANFVVLVVARLDGERRFEASATVFWPGGTDETAKLILDGSGDGE